MCGPETAADQVAEVVADKRPGRAAGQQQRDAGIGAVRGGHAERDDGGLAGQHRQDRLQAGTITAIA